MSGIHKRVAKPPLNADNVGNSNHANRSKQTSPAGNASYPRPCNTIVDTTEIVLPVVLARGWTRRISGDKALLQWNGKPLVRHALEAYIGLPTEPVIITKRPSAYAEFGVVVVTDAYTEETPISGILTAADYAADLHAEWVFIAGADTIPTIPHLYRRIWDERHGAPEHGAVLLQVAGQVQPFPGLYRTAALTAWRTAYREGRFKLTPTAESIPARRLAFDVAPYHNVNTTDSLPPAWKSA